MAECTILRAAPLIPAHAGIQTGPPRSRGTSGNLRAAVQFERRRAAPKRFVQHRKH